ncbi:tyrosine-type recombinase/integrase [Novosphingobium cyanobacteriorum]|uniref:Tyrosine-type recombinase/integrase n=1 Tax=Novosphingobium cyanobacteriorum TaxID=3024215 RepID=A0ABT6CLI7_9SPHN|nr:tyrosine-type recombinase/integrase [Novosphingobium cyanobacteriorum]MDF8334781.1 tyrosine-type recombinase/integrase [Novosphingobium cyanobacteriorum]
MTAHSLARIVAEELATVGIVGFKGTGRWGSPRRTVWSTTLPGFGVRHYSTGRRVYIVQTAMGGRLRTMTLGNANLFTDAEATDVARRILLRAQNGENPADTAKRIKASPRFDVFLEEFWKKVAVQWKPLTRYTNDCYRRLYLDDAFPKRFADEITHAEVVKWFARVSNTGGPGAGNRTLEILRTMMNKAEAWGYREECSNPCQGIRPNRRRKYECFLSNDELARLGAALEDLKRDYPAQATAILVLALTGCRRSEILGLTWGEVKGRRLLLHNSKTGPRTVWVGEEVRALIDALPRHPKHNRVFWSGDLDTLKNSVDYHFRLTKNKVGLPHVRLHDLRHSFASHAAAMSETLPMIGKLLGHAKIGSTARYAHLDDRQILQAVDKVGLLLDLYFSG